MHLSMSCCQSSGCDLWQVLHGWQAWSMLRIVCGADERQLCNHAVSCMHAADWLMWSILVDSLGRGLKIGLLASLRGWNRC